MRSTDNANISAWSSKSMDRNLRHTACTVTSVNDVTVDNIWSTALGTFSLASARRAGERWEYTLMASSIAHAIWKMGKENSSELERSVK